MRDKIYADFQEVGKNLYRYGTIVDRTDFKRGGKNFTELVIRAKGETGTDDVWNVTMVNGGIKQIMLVEV